MLFLLYSWYDIKIHPLSVMKDPLLSFRLSSLTYHISASHYSSYPPTSHRIVRFKSCFLYDLLDFIRANESDSSDSNLIFNST